MLLVFLLLGPAGLAVARRRKELPIDREPGEAGTQQRAKASGEQSLPTTKKRNTVTTRWKERVTSLFLWPVDTVVVGVLADVDGHSVEWEVAVAGSSSCKLQAQAEWPSLSWLNMSRLAFQPQPMFCPTPEQPFTLRSAPVLSCHPMRSNPAVSPNTRQWYAYRG